MSGTGGSSSSRSADRVESRDGMGEKAEAAAAVAPDDTLSPWLQGAGGVVTDDDEASSEDAVNMSEAAAFTAAKRSPPLPSSQKSRMCAAMGLEMSSCENSEVNQELVSNIHFRPSFLFFIIK